MSDFIHLNPIIEQIDSLGTETSTNLFSHEFYYLQNNQSDKTIRECCKALLFLHTLPVDYANMNQLFSKSTITINKFPKRVGYSDITSYWYMLLLGSMVWRRRYMKSHNNSEPLQLSFGNVTYKSPGVNNVWVSNSSLFCTTFQTTKYSKYTDYIDENANPLFEKEVLNLFLDFVDNKFQTVMNCCEFKVTMANALILLPHPQMINYSMFKQIHNAMLKTFTTGISVDYLTQYKILNGEQKISIQINNNSADYRLLGFYKNYVIGFMKSLKREEIENGSSTNLNGKSMTCPRIHTYYSEGNPVQEIFKEYFFSPCVVTSIPCNINSNGIPKDVLKQYYKGYADAITQGYENTNNTNEATIEIEKSKDERDLKCELYLSLKNIWDRWLCGYYYQEDGLGREMFTVQNFFRNNFIFIDSFYSNIYDTLKLNCNYLLQAFVGTGNNQTKLGKTTVAHLGDIASHHQCMMFNFPDSINFSGLDNHGNIKENDMYNHLADMFKPVPANDVTEPEYFNKFTIIYTHSANKLDTNDRNKFVPDTFDIWSYDQETDVAPTIFKSAVQGTGKTEAEKLYPEARIAYKVPAFGVAYSRQDNSFWKNIDVRMDNFSMTEQTVRAMAAVAELGSSEKKNCVFYGQDLYSIYQSYSYMVTVEMMGNAQIQPLMYFQLMNIPMFRGTYMIISVEHSMTPGMMVTKFTGMKMSKVQHPYTESWFTYPKDNDYKTVVNDASNDGQDVLTSIEGDKIDLADNNLSKIIQNHNLETMDCDVFVRTVYNEFYGRTVVPDKRINSETDDLFKYFNDNNDWKVTKFNPVAMKDNNWKTIYSGSNIPKVGDILFGYNNHKKDGLHSHMCIYLGIHGNNKYVVEGVSVPNGSDVINGTSGVQIVRFENSRLCGSDNLMTYFAHYIPGNIQQVEYAKVSTSSSGSGGGSTAPTTYRTDDTPVNKVMPEDHKPIPNVDFNKLENKENGLYIMEQLINTGLTVKGRTIKLNRLQAAAIAGCFYQESRWNPTATNPAPSHAYGIPQWLGERQTIKYRDYLVSKGERPGQRTATEMTTVSDQYNYIKYEFGDHDHKTYYSGTCKLWGNDPNGTVRFGKNVNLCGNLMAWSNVTEYNEDVLCNLVYRFMVSYENGNAPFSSEFCYDNRCKFAKMAYDLYESRHPRV